MHSRSALDRGCIGNSRSDLLIDVAPPPFLLHVGVANTPHDGQEEAESFLSWCDGCDVKWVEGHDKG